MPFGLSEWNCAVVLGIVGVLGVLWQLREWMIKR